MHQQFLSDLICCFWLILFLQNVTKHVTVSGPTPHIVSPFWQFYMLVLHVTQAMCSVGLTLRRPYLCLMRLATSITL